MLFNFNLKISSKLFLVLVLAVYILPSCQKNLPENKFQTPTEFHQEKNVPFCNEMLGCYGPSCGTFENESGGKKCLNCICS